MGPAQLNAEIDLAQAQQSVADAERAAETAAYLLTRAKREILYRDLRLRAARLGIAHWALGLGAGSVIALTTSLIAITVFATSIFPLLFLILIAYAAAGASAFWLLRARDGEGDQPVVEVRVEMLAAAHVQKDRRAQYLLNARSAAEASRRQLQLIIQDMQSETRRRQIETDRLLSIDGGRLYPDEFERYVAAIFRHLGYAVEVTGKAGDQGVDILAVKDSVRVAIQVKRHIGSVSNSAVQEVYAGMAHRRCHRCVVVTTGDFTASAMSLAQSTGCLMVGKDQIPALVRGGLGL
jgi:HJR/Mrr/RecB family endonuclease